MSQVELGRRHVAQCRPPLRPGQVVALSCTACKWHTDWWPIEREHLAEIELREHFAREHGHIFATI